MRYEMVIGKHEHDPAVQCGIVQQAQQRLKASSELKRTSVPLSGKLGVASHQTEGDKEGYYLSTIPISCKGATHASLSPLMATVMVTRMGKRMSALFTGDPDRRTNARIVKNMAADMHPAITGDITHDVTMAATPLT